MVPSCFAVDVPPRVKHPIAERSATVPRYSTTALPLEPGVAVTNRRGSLRLIIRFSKLDIVFVRCDARLCKV